MAVGKSNERNGFAFIWALENCQEMNLLSPAFVVDPMESTKWNLDLKKDFLPEPQQDDTSSGLSALNLPQSSATLSLSLIRAYKDGGPTSIDLDYELSILAHDGTTLLKTEGNKSFKKKEESEQLTFRIQEVFKEKRMKFMPADTLTVRCRMWRAGVEMERPLLICARSRYITERRSIVWTIPKFSSIEAGEKKCISIESNIKGAPSTLLTFYLVKPEYDETGMRILPDKGEGRKSGIRLTYKENPKYDGNGIIEVKQMNSQIVNITTYEISVIDAIGRVVFSVEPLFEMNPLSGQIWEIPIFTKNMMKEKDLWLPNDELHLRCNSKMSLCVDLHQIENYNTDTAIVRAGEPFYE